MFHFLINGFIIGILASMPVGAIAILSIQRTINGGLMSGFIIGLGAALADIIYASVAALGLTIISDFLLSIRIYLAIFGGVFLLVMGYKLYTSDTIKQIRSKRHTKSKHTNSFFTSFLIALSNPITIIGFTGFLASFGIITSNMKTNAILLLLSGITLGAITWWFSISFLVSAFKNKITLRLLITINRLAGVFLFLFGIGLLVAMFIFK